MNDDAETQSHRGEYPCPARAEEAVSGDHEEVRARAGGTEKVNAGDGEKLWEIRFHGQVDGRVAMLCNENGQVFRWIPIFLDGGE